MKVAAWANAAAPTPARAARSEAERAEREACQMRSCTPTRLEPPPRDGSIDLAEDLSVPEGQAKSEQAPIRRPPSRAEGHCTGARQAPFSFGPCTARFLFGQDRKENGGCIPLDKPPAGADTPAAAVRRPTSPRAADCRPYGPRMGPAEIRRADTQVRPYRSRQTSSSSDKS